MHARSTQEPQTNFHSKSDWQLSIEILYNLVQGTIYTLLLFFLIGFEWEASRFFYFLFFVAMSFNIFTLYGMMTVSFTPNHHIAGIVSSFFYVFWNVFTGYIIPRPVSARNLG
jgi:ABC-type multidrug transport system permease subunit